MATCPAMQTCFLLLGVSILFFTVNVWTIFYFKNYCKMLKTVLLHIFNREKRQSLYLLD